MVYASIWTHANAPAERTIHRLHGLLRLRAKTGTLNSGAYKRNVPVLALNLSNLRNLWIVRFDSTSRAG
jgi:hypothetical protein